MIDLHWWSNLSSHMPGRSSKELRDRWYHVICIQNEAMVDSESGWSMEEDHLLIANLQHMGTRWSAISRKMGGNRTADTLKHRWSNMIRVVERYVESSEKKGIFLAEPPPIQRNNPLFNYCLELHSKWDGRNLAAFGPQDNDQHVKLMELAQSSIAHVSNSASTAGSTLVAASSANDPDAFLISYQHDRRIRELEQHEYDTCLENELNQWDCERRDTAIDEDESTIHSAHLPILSSDPLFSYLLLLLDPMMPPELARIVYQYARSDTVVYEIWNADIQRGTREELIHACTSLDDLLQYVATELPCIHSIPPDMRAEKLLMQCCTNPMWDELLRKQMLHGEYRHDPLFPEIRELDAQRNAAAQIDSATGSASSNAKRKDTNIHTFPVTQSRLLERFRLRLLTGRIPMCDRSLTAITLLHMHCYCTGPSHSMYSVTRVHRVQYGAFSTEVSSQPNMI
jgi:hypothetical protein